MSILHKNNSSSSRKGMEKNVTIMPNEMRMNTVLKFVEAFKRSEPTFLIEDEVVLNSLDTNELPILSKAINLWLKKRARMILDVMQQTEGFLDASSPMTSTLFHYNNGTFDMTEKSEVLPVIYSLQRDPTLSDVVKAIFIMTLWSGLQPDSQSLFLEFFGFVRSLQKKKRAPSSKFFHWIMCFFHMFSHMTRLVFHVKLLSLKLYDPNFQIFFVEGCLKTAIRHFRDVIAYPEKTFKFTFPSKSLSVSENLQFDNLLAFSTASFVSMCHSGIYHLKSIQNSSLKESDTIGAIQNWSESETISQRAVQVFCGGSLDELTNYISILLTVVQSDHSLSTFVHFAKLDDDKFEHDIYLRRTQQFGIGADDESSNRSSDKSSGDKDFINNFDEDEDSYQRNPFIDDEAGEQDNGEESEEDYFDKLDESESAISEGVPKKKSRIFGNDKRIPSSNLVTTHRDDDAITNNNTMLSEQNVQSSMKDLGRIKITPHPTTLSQKISHREHLGDISDLDERSVTRQLKKNSRSFNVDTATNSGDELIVAKKVLHSHLEPSRKTAKQLSVKKRGTSGGVVKAKYAPPRTTKNREKTI